MHPNLPPDLLPRVKKILLPLVATPEDREALLLDAFYTVDPFLYRIDRSGTPSLFGSRCIAQLIEYSARKEGEHALVRLLLTMREYHEPEQHAEIDELIERVEMHCRPGKPDSAEPSAAARKSGIPKDAPIAGRPATVFITYSRQDTDFAKQLIADLEQAGHACWIDTTKIKGGDEWVDMIADAIRNSYALVVLVTKKSLNSLWVRKEILWAEQKQKLIVPMILEDVLNENRFFPLINFQGIKLFETGYELALGKLRESLPSAPSADPLQIEDAPVPAIARIETRQLQGPSRKRELEYLERLLLEELLNTEKYTPLGGTSQQKRPEMRAVFELMRMGEQHGPAKRFENAIEEIRRLRRVVLLGEPGGGKTTTIWKLAAELVAEAMQNHKAPIPLLVRLGRWTEEAKFLPAFIAAQLGELGAHLPQLLAEKRAVLLLDGLNELPVGHRDFKYPQVKKLIQDHPALMAVVSCREHDYTVDLGFDKIAITPLDPLRIREFAEKYLGKEQGDSLFWRFVSPQVRQSYERLWAELAQKHPTPEQILWQASELPKEIVWESQDRQKEIGLRWSYWLLLREIPNSLMMLARNPYMLLMLCSVYAEHGRLPENRGDLFRLFVDTLLKREQVPPYEQAPLIASMARVAYEMQSRCTNDEQGSAQTTLLKKEVDILLDERSQHLARSASILSVGEKVRFTHQLLQEYFAAKYMDLEIHAGRLRAETIWPRDRWWERTNWEEASVLLAGLYEYDCSGVVNWLADANPELAAICATQSGAKLPATTAERLRDRWIPRLTDLQRDPAPAARANIGRALGRLGLDNRKGVATIVDRNGVTMPDIDWVEIPAGEFLYGEGNPPQKLTLPTFFISRYPITFAQFQAFLDDPSGFNEPRWFDGMTVNADQRDMWEQEFKFSNHPRETVNWYQAMAFCRWFSWRLGGGTDLKKIDEWAVRLPTEFEWEKAARGVDGRIYPYEGEYDPAKANVDGTRLNQTSAVGIFPNGASPYGVMDMSGNVREWCLSNYENPALLAAKENLRNDKRRVLRGGSWYGNQMFARAVYRNLNHPASRNLNIGFRVVCSVCPPSL